MGKAIRTIDTNFFIEEVIHHLDTNKHQIGWEQFEHCNAYLGDTQCIPDETGEVHKIMPIKSYNTIVGYIDFYDDICYEYGKYSRTTSCQVTRIASDYGMGKVYVDVSTAGRW